MRVLGPEMWFSLELGMREMPARPYGAANGAIADGLPAELGMNSGNELVAIGGTERGRSVGDRQELRLGDS